MNNTYIALTKSEKSNFLLRSTDERTAWAKARRIAREKGLATVEKVFRVYQDFSSVGDQPSEQPGALG